MSPALSCNFPQTQCFRGFPLGQQPLRPSTSYNLQRHRHPPSPNPCKCWQIPAPNSHCRMKPDCALPLGYWGPSLPSLCAVSSQSCLRGLPDPTAPSLTPLQTCLSTSHWLFPLTRTPFPTFLPGWLGPPPPPPAAPPMFPSCLWLCWEPSPHRKGGRAACAPCPRCPGRCPTRS